MIFLDPRPQKRGVFTRIFGKLKTTEDCLTLQTHKQEEICEKSSLLYTGM